jgi:hypothetical protein
MFDAPIGIDVPSSCGSQMKSICSAAAVFEPLP